MVKYDKEKHKKQFRAEKQKTQVQHNEKLTYNISLTS